MQKKKREIFSTQAKSRVKTVQATTMLMIVITPSAPLLGLPLDMYPPLTENHSEEWGEEFNIHSNIEFSVLPDEDLGEPMKMLFTT